ncbi:unnamed protein product [Calypogeia fissa]
MLRCPGNSFSDSAVAFVTEYSSETRSEARQQLSGFCDVRKLATNAQLIGERQQTNGVGSVGGCIEGRRDGTGLGVETEACLSVLDAMADTSIGEAPRPE